MDYTTAFVTFAPLSSRRRPVERPAGHRVVCVAPVRLGGEKSSKPSGASLPQDVSEAARIARREQLRDTREQYVYKAPDTIPDIAFIESIERLDIEKPRAEWLEKLNEVEFQVDLATLRPFEKLPESIAFWGLRQLSTLFNKKKPPVVESPRNTRGAVPKDFEQTSKVLSRFRELYQVLPFPRIAEVFMDDSVFARLRVAGFNPMTLFAVNEENCPFLISNDRCLPGDTLESAMEEKRLYALDYSILSSVKQEEKNLLSDRKFAICKALFCVPRGGYDAELIPLAIEVNGGIAYPPRPNEDEFPAAWTLAKLCVNVCDAMHHQLVAHLSRTHLLIESVLLSTMHQLPTEHPVHQLMRPHFEGTAFINDTAANNLVRPNGPVDMVLAGELNSSMEIVTATMNNFDFNGGFPDADQMSRGLDNPNLKSPYRDDALKHWAALKQWVGDFLGLYYTSDADVQEDEELSNWAKELCDETKGRLKNFGDKGDGVICTFDYLVSAVSFFIFSGSIQHAAVNFPQNSIMLYPPAVAGFINGDVPDFNKEVTFDDWVNGLNPQKAAVNQIKELSSIGLLYHTRLGYYRNDELPNDPRVVEANNKYKQRLEEIEKEIATREANEPIKYEFLKPSNVPQSTNI